MQTEIKKCECDKESFVPRSRYYLYDNEKELPFVNHKPHECKCTNELKQYKRNGKLVWLCSCCC